MATDETGPPGRPLIGHTLPFFRRPLEFRRRCTESYGGVVRLSVLGRDVYFLADPEHIETAMVGKHRNLSRFDSLQKRLEPTLGRGLLNSDGEFWKRQRRLVQPAFHPERIETEYAGVMREEAERFLARWDPGGTYEMYDEMKTLVLRILVRTVLGDDVAPERVGNALEDIYEKRLTLPEWVPAPSNRRFKRGLSALDSLLYDLIDRRREQPGDGDVLDHLIRAETPDGTGMTDEEIRDEVATLLFAGHDTTSLSLTYTLYLLARHPEVQARLGAELDEALSERSPSADRLDDLAVVDRVYREALRLYPPAYDVRRQADRPTEIGGREIPEGAIVDVSPWAVHHDRRWYDDPEQFRPGRWTGDFEAELPDGAYIPFGAGPHLCIGRMFGLIEGRIVLATLARRFEFEYARTDPVEVKPTSTLRPDSPVEVTVRDRESAGGTRTFLRRVG